MRIQFKDKVLSMWSGWECRGRQRLSRDNEESSICRTKDDEDDDDRLSKVFQAILRLLLLAALSLFSLLSLHLIPNKVCRSRSTIPKLAEFLPDSEERDQWEATSVDPQGMTIPAL